MKFDLYDSNGTKKGQIEVNKDVFSAKVNEDLMHRAIVMRLANKRNSIAHTQTRSEVTGTTKKAFRQKGTGNARRGALKTTLLRGGAASHGPRNDRNFTKSMPKKERRQALFSSLSKMATDKNVIVLEKFAEKIPKTKNFIELLAKLPVGKKYLFVIPQKDLVFEKSMANIPNVDYVLASYTNPLDVLKADKVCFLQDSLPVLEDTFLDKK